MEEITRSEHRAIVFKMNRKQAAAVARYLKEHAGSSESIFAVDVDTMEMILQAKNAQEDDVLVLEGEEDVFEVEEETIEENEEVWEAVEEAVAEALGSDSRQDEQYRVEGLRTAAGPRVCLQAKPPAKPVVLTAFWGRMGSFVLFLDVAHRQRDDLARVAVGQAVVEHLSIAADGDQPGLAQRPQLIGNRAGRHPDGLGQLARTQLAGAQRQQNLEPRVRADRAEKLGQRGDIFVAGHGPARLLRCGQLSLTCVVLHSDLHVRPLGFLSFIVSYCAVFVKRPNP